MNDEHRKARDRNDEKTRGQEDEGSRNRKKGETREAGRWVTAASSAY